MSLQPNNLDPSLDCIHSSGPWPFVTRRVYQSADASQHVWSSRHHRKGLLLRAENEAEKVAGDFGSWIWNPASLNWWIGCVFAVGAILFAVASVLSLSSSLADAMHLNTIEINAIFFVGSIPFTTAAYLQLFQAANVATNQRDAERSHRHAIIGWRPTDIGWLSSILQFVGTILFNLNTFDAMIPSLGWFEQELLIWVPNIMGSILFLASGYLAFIETCHAHWAWKPHDISWCVVFTNLLGCVGFMIAAVFSFVTPLPHPEAVTLSLVFTLLGAIGFFVGSILMLPEASLENQTATKSSGV